MSSACALAANYVDDFNSDPAPPGGWPITSFSTGTPAIGLTYTGTFDGDECVFSWSATGGDGDSGRIDVTSSVLNTWSTERFTIVSNNGEVFVFNSVYIDICPATETTGFTITGVGPEPFTIVTGCPGTIDTYSPSGGSKLVTSVSISSVDFYDDHIDNVNVDVVTAPAPEINVKRGAASIADGGTDNVGNQTVGTVNLTYTIDNTGGTAALNETAVTPSNYVNSSGFAVRGYGPAPERGC